jgi:hypothetical protein
MFDPNNCPHISTLLKQKRDFGNTILIYGKGMPAKWDNSIGATPQSFRWSNPCLHLPITVVKK